MYDGMLFIVSLFLVSDSLFLHLFKFCHAIGSRLWAWFCHGPAWMWWRGMDENNTPETAALWMHASFQMFPMHKAVWVSNDPLCTIASTLTWRPWTLIFRNNVSTKDQQCKRVTNQIRVEKEQQFRMSLASMPKRTPPCPGGCRPRPCRDGNFSRRVRVWVWNFIHGYGYGYRILSADKIWVRIFTCGYPTGARNTIIII